MTDSRDSSHVDVLVVGAGPTGLTLGCDLARRGVAVRIVEKSGEPRPGSRGKGLQPRTLEVFDDLGVLDAIRAAGGPYPRVRVHVGPFAIPWQLTNEDAPTEHVPYPNPWMVLQARTEAVLRARFVELGGRLELGHELRSLEQDREGISASVVHDGREEIIRARYLVAADGGHSAVRKLLGIPLRGPSVAMNPAIVGDLRIPGLDDTVWHAWPFAKGGTVALCPLAKTDLFQLFMQVDAKSAREDAPLERTWVEALLERATGQRIAVREALWLSRYRPNVRLADRYRVGRVFLAGDAAHVHPPTGGQGLNAGVQDAYNLGWKLGAVLSGAPEHLLETYEEERRPVAQEILGMSTRLYGKKWQRRREESTQLKTHYETSSLVRELRAPRGRRSPLRAGDRMPDARGAVDGRECRLFDVLRGPHATLLAFGAEAAQVARQVRGQNLKLSGFVSETLARSFEAETVLLVRPDGYIGFAAEAGRAKAALEQYASAF